MITVFDVANYFLFLVDPDTEDCVTNLKLQKFVITHKDCG